MSNLLKLYHSSIGKKFVVGTTGLLLCAYLIVHLGGNLLLFKDDGGKSFDMYAEVLPSLLVIRIIEIGLFAIFLAHIITGTYVWLQNRKARPTKYALNRPAENSSVFSRTMFLTGSIVFIFLVIHMMQFWFPSRFATEHVSMYGLVRGALQNPVYGIFYIIAMGLLAFHLRHGFQSAAQTFGLSTQSYRGIIEAIGAIFWLLIPLAFASMPVYFLFTA